MTMLPTYFPSPPQGVWHLGPLPIRAYALFIITGIVVALMIGDRRWVARGGERGVIYDIALWVVPFGLIGGRLYHLATDWRTYWGPGGAGLGAAFRIWDGGLGIWGAVALGVRRSVDRLPASRNSATGLHRRGCPGNHLGAGHRSARELLQSGALRPGNHGAVGPGDLLPPGSLGIHRPAFARRRLDGAGGGRRAADVSVRIDLERPGFRHPDLHGPAVHDGSRAAVRGLCRAAIALGASGSSCCATTPPPTSPVSGSIRSHRLSCSSVPWFTSFWRRRVARIPKVCGARITLPRNPRNLSQKSSRPTNWRVSLRLPQRRRRPQPVRATTARNQRPRPSRHQPRSRKSKKRRPKR